jgi:hypothetical protein
MAQKCVLSGIFLLCLVCAGCKGDKGDTGAPGQTGRSFRDDRIVRQGVILSDTVFVSIPNLDMQRSIVTVNLMEATGKWVEFPVYNPTTGVNGGWVASNSGVEILNAWSLGFVSYSIIVFV